MNNKKITKMMNNKKIINIMRIIKKKMNSKYKNKIKKKKF